MTLFEDPNTRRRPACAAIGALICFVLEIGVTHGGSLVSDMKAADAPFVIIIIKTCVCGFWRDLGGSQFVIEGYKEEGGGRDGSLSSP